jgi:hypothetical protein
MGELVVEEVVTVAEGIESGGFQVDQMDARNLFDHVLGHPVDPIRRIFKLNRNLPLVYSAIQALHDIERPPENIACLVDPQRAWRPNRRCLNCTQDVELPA